MLSGFAALAVFLWALYFTSFDRIQHKSVPRLIPSGLARFLLRNFA